MNIKIQSQNNILLCCGKKGCPSIKREDANSYILTDDLGGQIKLNAEELKAIPEAIEAFNRNSDKDRSN